MISRNFDINFVIGFFSVIQRIQTLFLTFAALLSGAFVFTPLYSHILEDPSRWIFSAYLASSLLSTLVSIWAIFLYTNRGSQMQWVKRAMMFQTIAIAVATGITFSLGGFGHFLMEELLSLGGIVLVWVLQFLALRFIKKDEDLVRSMDRLR